MSSSEKLSGVYAIIHQPSGRAYVGSSKDISGRWSTHVGRLNGGRHPTIALMDLWLLDGPSAFTFVVLEQCAIENLACREQEWMDSVEDLLNTSRRAMGPSLDPRIAQKIASSLRGRPLTEERKRNISAARKSKPLSEKTRAHLARLHSLLRQDVTRRRALAERVSSKPDVKAQTLARHWSRSPQAAEVVRRTNETKRLRREQRKELASP